MSSLQAQDISLTNWKVLSKVDSNLLSKIILVSFFNGEGESALFQFEDLEVYGIGRNTYGMLGTGDSAESIVKSPGRIPELSGLHVTAFACGRIHCLALTGKGEVWAWGYNGNGEMGQGTTSDPKLRPHLVPGLSNVIKISAGDAWSLIINKLGEVYAWGYNLNAQCGTKGEVRSPRKVQFPEGTVITAASCGSHHAVALSSLGKVFCWGKNSSGQLGLGKVTSVESEPQVIANHPQGGFLKISAGKHHSLALSKEGEVYVWGENSGSLLGVLSVDNYISTPKIIPGIPRGSHLVASCLYFITVVETVDGVYQWGDYDQKYSVGLHSTPRKMEVKNAASCFHDRYFNSIEIKKKAIPATLTGISKDTSEMKVKIESKAVCNVRGDLILPSNTINTNLEGNELFIEECTHHSYNSFLKHIQENEMELKDIFSLIGKLEDKSSTKYGEFKTNIIKSCKQVLLSENALESHKEFLKFHESDSEDFNLDYIFKNFNIYVN